MPTALISLDLRFCSALRKLGGLSGLAELKKLDFTGCNIELDELLSVETLISSGLELTSTSLDTFDNTSDGQVEQQKMAFEKATDALDSDIEYDVLSDSFC